MRSSAPPEVTPTGGDLSEEALSQALPGRRIRSYASIVSTEADAMAQCRAGAPEGTLIVADYQIAARSRPRRPWRSLAGNSISFSLVMRPQLPPVRAGILYVVATAGVAAACGEAATIDWPDEVYTGDHLSAQIGVHLEVTVRGVEWAAISCLVHAAKPPRAPLLARIVDAIETRYRVPPADLVAEWSARCRTIGRTAAIVTYPIGAGREIEGRATGVRLNGSLLLDVGAAHELAVAPHELASIELGPL